jgi:hypothetical protein
LARAEIMLAEGEQKDLLLTGSVPTRESPQSAPEASTAPTGAGQTPDRPRRLYKSWILWTAVGAAVVGGAIAIAVTSKQGDEGREPIAEGNTGSGVIRW